MVIDDHINLMRRNPLVGANDDRFGPRFPDMTEVYSSRLRANCRSRPGKRSACSCRTASTSALLGPSYETPAEIRYLRTIGADAVGMSTVPEAIAARHMGIEVLGISCITNMAAGVLPQPLDHAEVMETARRVRGQFIALLEGDHWTTLISRRLSVSLIDVGEGHEAEFLDAGDAVRGAPRSARSTAARRSIRDEGQPLRFYAVRYWTDAAAAEQCHARSRSPGADRAALSDRARHPRRQRRAPPGRRPPDARRAPRARRRRSPHRLRSPRRRRRPAPKAIAAARRSAARPAPRARSRRRGRSRRRRAPRPRACRRGASRNFKVGAALETADGSSSPAATSRTRPTA